jgi:hypothetical protein
LRVLAVVCPLNWLSRDEINEIVVDQALNGFIVFRSSLAGYNSDVLGGVAIWPEGAVAIPDPRETWVKAGS